MDWIDSAEAARRRAERSVERGRLIRARLAELGVGNGRGDEPQPSRHGTEKIAEARRHLHEARAAAREAAVRAADMHELRASSLALRGRHEDATIEQARAQREREQADALRQLLNATRETA